MIGKIGTIVSWTLVRVPPADFMDQAPYPVALVKLERGQMICAQLVDWGNEDLAIGKKVVTVLRRVTHPDPDGVIPYGIKVKPI